MELSLNEIYLDLRKTGDYLTEKEILKLTSLKQSTLRNYMAVENFPKALTLTFENSKYKLWSRDLVEKWVEEWKASRR